MRIFLAGALTLGAVGHACDQETFAQLALAAAPLRSPRTARAREIREEVLAELRTRYPDIEDVRVTGDPNLRNVYTARVLRNGNWETVGSIQFEISGTHCTIVNVGVAVDFRRAGVNRLLFAEMLSRHGRVRRLTGTLGGTNFASFLVALARTPQHADMPALVARYTSDLAYRTETQQIVLDLLAGPLTPELRRRIDTAYSRHTRLGTLHAEFGMPLRTLSIVHHARHVGTDRAFDIVAGSDADSRGLEPFITVRRGRPDEDD